MSPQVLYACLPCLVALGLAMGTLLLILRVSRLRPDFSRLWRLHSCEVGGVQTLSFVLTLPIFVMICLFVVQVSQLMIGVIVVNYATFAAVRSASVWLPADLGPDGADPRTRVEGQNKISEAISVAQNGDILQVILPANSSTNTYKLDQIQLAAVMACAPIAPSRNLQSGFQGPPWLMQAIRATSTLYPQMVPAAQTNIRIPMRISNKMAYSYQNTGIVLEWLEARHPQKDVEESPTYNPRRPDVPCLPEWIPTEVGWQDPITVHVTHRFALLPGPGRFLAQRLVMPNGTVDRVSPRIFVNPNSYQEKVYYATISASGTLVNEGFKSVYPYVQQQ